MHHAHIDKYANQQSIIHSLDARTKLLVVVVFTFFVILRHPSQTHTLPWYAVGPFAMMVFGGVPIKFVLKQLLIVSPFVAVLGISCVFFDKQPTEIYFGPWHWETTGGRLRFLSIVLKFIITFSALITLTSTTRFNELLAGMEKLGMPRLMVTQLGFLYRYIFLLIDKVGRMLRARGARRLMYLGFSHELKTAGSMIGNLLISSLDMAERTSVAMEARGYDGQVRTLSESHFDVKDWVFAAVSAAYMTAMAVLL